MLCALRWGLCLVQKEETVLLKPSDLTEFSGASMARHDKVPSLPLFHLERDPAREKAWDNVFARIVLGPLKHSFFVFRYFCFVLP